MSRKTAALLSIVFLLVCLVAINILVGATFRSARLDLTEGRLYTLSAGTKSMLSKLEEPITLKLFFSQRLAANYQGISVFGARARDVLGELALHSRGHVRVEFIDPEPFGGDEEVAEAYGLRGAETDTGEKIFLGIVGTNLVDGLEAIPFLSPDRETYLEYDLASLIHRLATPQKQKLGVLSSLPLSIGSGGYMAVLQGGTPYVIYEQLNNTFDLVELGKDLRVVPDDVGVVLVAHPPALSSAALYALDQFAMRGGRLLVFVDPFSEAVASSGVGSQPMAGLEAQSDLAPLFAKWGVAYDPTAIVLDQDRAMNVRAGGDYGGIMPYIAWLRLREGDINRADLIAADIETIQVASAGSISPLEGASTRFVPLLSTSYASQKIPAMVMSVSGDPQSLLNDFVADDLSHVIAARVTGPVQSAFPDGPPADGTATDDALAPELPLHMAASEAPLNLVVVADADILEDQFWVETASVMGQRIAQPTAGNGSFVFNAVDQFMGADELISLRSRGMAERPFEVVQALERKAQQQFRAEETRLEAEILETEARLEALQTGEVDAEQMLAPEGTVALLTTAQTEEVHRFQEKLAQSRRALRAVQGELRADVVRLGAWVKFLNIVLVPLVVAVFAISLAVLRRRRRTQARLAAMHLGG